MLSHVLWARPAMSNEARAEAGCAPAISGLGGSRPHTRAAISAGSGSTWWSQHWRSRKSGNYLGLIRERPFRSSALTSRPTALARAPIVSSVMFCGPASTKESWALLDRIAEHHRRVGSDFNTTSLGGTKTLAVVSIPIAEWVSAYQSSAAPGARSARPGFPAVRHVCTGSLQF
jgi:hypothetical protein